MGIGVNKDIWLYWHQGWEGAPILVTKCAETWAQNKGWRIHFLSRDSLNAFIKLPIYVKGDFALPALSDIIRIYLLHQYGGVWADATTFCMRPLDEWIEEATSPTGFFAYAKPAQGRPLSSWFLAANRGHYITGCWKSAVDQYWTENIRENLTDNPNDTNYFWFHGLFQQLLENDDKFRLLWEACIHISADGPHFLQSVGLLSCATEAIQSHIVYNSPHVYKLTRRISIPDDITGTVLDELFRNRNAAK